MEFDIYEEIALFMDVAFPKWVMQYNSNIGFFLDSVEKENGFLFSNSNLDPVVKLAILYESIARIHGQLSSELKVYDTY